MLSFSKLWKEFPPKKEWAMHRVADSPVCFPFCNAVLMPLFPGAQAFWPRVDPAVQFSATLVPASFSLHQPFSLPLVLPHLPLTSIFFSVVASLVLRAEINCSSALRAYTFSCWHMSPRPLSRSWRRGFQSIVPALKPCCGIL